MTDLMKRALVGLLGAVCLSAGLLQSAERDLYVRLPKTLPAGAWNQYLGEIGADTLVTYKLGKEGAKQSTVSMVWFQNLYNTRELLEKTAPTLKKILETQIHKGDTVEKDKQPGAVFGLKPNDKNSLVVYFEFKHVADTEDRKAGIYRYYYLFKRIDEKTSISLGIEVRLMDPEHAGPIDELLANCGFRTDAEIQAETKANAAQPKPATPAGGDKPTGAATPTEAPKPADSK